MKLLGIIIDDKLNFSGHVKTIAVKIGRLVGVIIIMRLRNIIPEKVKLQLYRTAILPHLTYCSSIHNFRPQISVYRPQLPSTLDPHDTHSLLVHTHE